MIHASFWKYGYFSTTHPRDVTLIAANLSNYSKISKAKIYNETNLFDLKMLTTKLVW